ncbi:MAG: AEC family transporter [Hyphomonadaceae bacterium]|nr:AEC family transporter [Hyphomonadaceae bacterium]
MPDIFQALAPIFIIIALGFAARAARIFPEETWGAVNRFGYFVPYPAFLFSTTAGADLHAHNAGPFLTACIAGFLAMAGIALSTRLLFRKDGPAFTSVFQGAARWNGFVILAAGDRLYGAGGRELIALAFGPLVLMVNIICVGVLARWGKERIVSTRALAAQIAGNPLVLSCAAGLAFNLARTLWGFGDLGVASDALKTLGAAALPLALVCIGAGLDFGPLRRGWTYVATSCALKLVAGPAVLYASALAFGLDARTAAVCGGIGATSTAAASYTLAREMGGDARLMAGIVTATTLLSFITMPIAIALTR